MLKGQFLLFAPRMSQATGRNIQYGLMKQKNIIEEQNKRILEAWELLRGQPAHLLPITKSTYKFEKRPEIANTFSYSIANFAMRVFTLEEEERYEEANQAIIRNCEYYETHQGVRDDRDSYYWSICLFLRILKKYGSFAPEPGGGKWRFPASLFELRRTSHRR